MRDFNGQITRGSSVGLRYWGLTQWSPVRAPLGQWMFTQPLTTRPVILVEVYASWSGLSGKKKRQGKMSANCAIHSLSSFELVFITRCRVVDYRRIE